METQEMIFRVAGELAVTTTVSGQNRPFSQSPQNRKIVKKLPPELRKRKPAVEGKTPWYRRLLIRPQNDSQFLRSTVQAAFVLLCIWIGIEFALFVRWGSSGGQTHFVPRPPGAEGFLPISSLMGLVYWIRTGIVNGVHPAGFFIFVAIALIGLFLKKAFCSWLCPVGTLSESLHLLGKRLFGRNIQLPRWLDYPLRSLKYLLFSFFLFSILQLDIPSLRAFIYSPYNKMADVKMYLFFSEISTFAVWTIIILMLLSLFIKNFWCRYLCPYGAFLGALSWLSPLKITRNKTTCIDCELCTRACPANIQIHQKGRIWSDECTNCLACVAVCPVKETLEVRAASCSRRIPEWVLGALIVGTFVAVTGLGIILGRWNTEMQKEEYLIRFQRLDSPLYQHNHGQVPEYGPND